MSYVTDGQTHRQPDIAKGNIPAHPIFDSAAYLYLDLWATLKIKRVHPLIMVYLSAKFDEGAHKGLVSIVFTSLYPCFCTCISIVTLTFDLPNQ